MQIGHRRRLRFSARCLVSARRLARPLALAIVGLVAVLLVAPTIELPVFAQSTFWISMFDGRPSSPQQYNPSTWDVLVHSRNGDTWKQLEPMQAHHGSTCSGPPATHPISGYNQAVFQCNDHVMTAIQAEGYGLIVLTPNQMVDFAGGEAIVRFDMSTFRASSRDWVSIWLSPWEDQIPLPLTDWLPDLTGEPRRGIHITMDSVDGKSTFRGSTIRDFRSTDVTTDTGLTYESFLTTSAVRRDTFELRISRTSLKFGMPGYNKWWIDRSIPDLGWDRAVLQLAHHSYTPWKGCMNGNCDANTWHWDNVSISRSVPFVMLKGDQPWVDSTTRRWVSFQSGAPVNSFLRFVGIGSGLQVSFDGGQNWQNAQMHAVEHAHEEHFKPYWMPVPAGTTRVDFRGSGWYGGDWMVRGPVFWSQTIPLPPPSSNCATRPRTTIQTQAMGGGRLQVTVQVGRPATAPNNIVRKVQIVRADNAQVEILGQTLGAGGGSVTPTSPHESLTFTVAKQPAGAPTSVTVPFIVTDDCGEWTTFVGGGPNAL
jgi:hypothetical protein